MSKVPLYCNEGASGITRIAAIDWYNRSSNSDTSIPSLAIGLENGRIQLMCNETDEKGLVIDTGKTEKLAQPNIP